MRCEINTFTAFAPCYHPRGYSRFQVTGMFEWGQKSKPKKFPWASNKTPKKSLDQNLTPQKFHAEFLCHKNFQKALNGVTRKLETLVLNSQKILYLNQATQKITCQNFPTQKISKTKISNPKNPLMILVTWNSKYPPWAITSCLKYSYCHTLTFWGNPLSIFNQILRSFYPPFISQMSTWLLPSLLEQKDNKINMDI